MPTKVGAHHFRAGNATLGFSRQLSIRCSERDAHRAKHWEMALVPQSLSYISAIAKEFRNKTRKTKIEFLFTCTAGKMQ
jgi:hypothetical protein